MTLLDNWNGTYDGLPAEAKMLIRIGFEFGWEKGQRAAKIAAGFPPFTSKEADLFAAVVRRRRSTGRIEPGVSE